MASKVLTTLVCDGCDKEDDGEAIEVQTYTVQIGKLRRTFEACGSCLPPGTLRSLMEAGRKDGL